MYAAFRRRVTSLFIRPCESRLGLPGGRGDLAALAKLKWIPVIVMALTAIVTIAGALDATGARSRQARRRRPSADPRPIGLASLEPPDEGGIRTRRVPPDGGPPRSGARRRRPRWHRRRHRRIRERAASTRAIAGRYRRQEGRFWRAAWCDPLLYGDGFDLKRILDLVVHTGSPSFTEAAVLRVLDRRVTLGALDLRRFARQRRRRTITGGPAFGVRLSPPAEIPPRLR